MWADPDRAHDIWRTKRKPKENRPKTKSGYIFLRSNFWHKSVDQSEVCRMVRHINKEAKNR